MPALVEASFFRAGIPVQIKAVGDSPTHNFPGRRRQVISEATQKETHLIHQANNALPWAVPLQHSCKSSHPHSQLV